MHEHRNNPRSVRFISTHFIYNTHNFARRVRESSEIVEWAHIQLKKQSACGVCVCALVRARCTFCRCGIGVFPSSFRLFGTRSKSHLWLWVSVLYALKVVGCEFLVLSLCTSFSFFHIGIHNPVKSVGGICDIKRVNTYYAYATFDMIRVCAAFFLSCVVVFFPCTPSQLFFLRTFPSVRAYSRSI